MQTRKSQWGNKGIRVSDACPTKAIDWKMGKVSVNTSDVEIGNMIRTGVRDSKDGRWTPALTKEAIRYALWVHEENRAEYDAVVGARI